MLLAPLKSVLDLESLADVHPKSFQESSTPKAISCLLGTIPFTATFFLGSQTCIFNTCTVNWCHPVVCFFNTKKWLNELILCQPLEEMNIRKYTKHFGIVLDFWRASIL